MSYSVKMQAGTWMGACHVGCYDVWSGLLCASSHGHQSLLPPVWQACGSFKAHVMSLAALQALHSCLTGPLKV